MDKKSQIKLRLISYAVIAYMILAFGWWSVLLFTKNEDAFIAKRDQMILLKIAGGEIQAGEQILDDPEYLALEKAYRQQEWMITGEVIVFICILIVGLRLINNGYNKQIMAAEQRRNFLLSITHELKSPIASIRLVLETIKKRTLKPDQKARLLQNGLTETDRLHQLVNNLLLSARLESAYQPNQEMVDLPVLIDELIESIKTQKKTVHFTFQSANEIPYLLGDRMGITSVILNLFENAIKYSREAAIIDVKLEADGQQIILSIADQGIGIAEKEKKKVFEKFYRVGSEDTRRTKGTGLGLYIVEQIVKAHQGTIQVLNNQPEGSVFRICFPVNSSLKTSDDQVFSESTEQL